MVLIEKYRKIPLIQKAAAPQKRKGYVGSITAVYYLIFLLAAAWAVMQVYMYHALGTYAEDALAASNLASAVIDIQEYGITHSITVQTPDNAYLLYQKALKANMGLDDSWMSANGNAISGRVQIVDYIVYNVKPPNVEIYSYGSNPYSTVAAGGLGSVRAPNGTIIESTSIYSRITFPVEGVFGIQTTAVKDKLVDIVD